MDNREKSRFCGKAWMKTKLTIRKDVTGTTKVIEEIKDISFKDFTDKGK